MITPEIKFTSISPFQADDLNECSFTRNKDGKLIIEIKTSDDTYDVWIDSQDQEFLFSFLSVMLKK